MSFRPLLATPRCGDGAGGNVAAAGLAVVRPIAVGRGSGRRRDRRPSPVRERGWGFRGWLGSPWFGGAGGAGPVVRDLAGGEVHGRPGRAPTASARGAVLWG